MEKREKKKKNKFGILYTPSSDSKTKKKGKIGYEDGLGTSRGCLRPSVKQ